MHYTTAPRFCIDYPLVEAYFSLIVLSFLLLGSPGPAPLAIAATGAIFGLRIGLRFLLGLLLGFVLVVLIQGLTMRWLVAENQLHMQFLQVIGFIYILYIAFKVAQAPIANQGAEPGLPPNAIDGLVLNLTNPKAYAAMTAINSQVLLPYQEPVWAYSMTGLVCFLVVVIIDFLWLILGHWISPMVQSPTTGRKIRLMFALSMLVAVLWIMIKTF